MSFVEIKKNISYFVGNFGNDLELIIAVGVAFILLVILLLYRIINDEKAKKEKRHTPPKVFDSNELTEKKAPTGLAAVMTSLQAQQEKETEDGIPLSLDEQDDVFIEKTNANNDPNLGIEIRDPKISGTETVATSDMETNRTDKPIRKKPGLFSFGNKNKDTNTNTDTNTDRNARVSTIADAANAIPSGQEPALEDIMNEIAADVSAALNTSETTQESEPTKNTIDQLQDLERQMKALRELHDAGLIATEIYLHKSRELASKI